MTTYASNTALYADPHLTEGVDWARRFRRHELFDDSLAFTGEVTRTTIIAPHGGGIEPGTSELCLAVAGYHPAMLPETPPAGMVAYVDDVPVFSDWNPGNTSFSVDKPMTGGTHQLRVEYFESGGGENAFGARNDQAGIEVENIYN
jgi:hypothetical protein